MRISDWSSDVCSSGLGPPARAGSLHPSVGHPWPKSGSCAIHGALSAIPARADSAVAFGYRSSKLALACSWAFVGARTVPAPLLLAGEGGAKRRVRVRHFAAAGADARCSYPCAVTSTTFPLDALLPQHGRAAC